MHRADAPTGAYFLSNSLPQPKENIFIESNAGTKGTTSYIIIMIILYYQLQFEHIQCYSPLLDPCMCIKTNGRYTVESDL